MHTQTTRENINERRLRIIDKLDEEIEELRKEEVSLVKEKENVENEMSTLRQRLQVLSGVHFDLHESIHEVRQERYDKVVTKFALRAVMKNK